MESDRITVEHAERSDHDIDQILALNTLEYGAEDILATRADFAWRCDRNPAGPAVIPVIRNRYGDIIGFIFQIPIRVRIKGENYLAAMGTDLVIQAEYRNTLAYVKLIRRFEQNLLNDLIPLHFSFVSEDNFQNLQARQKHSSLTIPFLLKPFNFKGLIEADFLTKWQRFIGHQARCLVSPFFFKNPFLRYNSNMVVRSVEKFDATFDEFWRQTQDKYPAMVIRDRAFLSWRFASVSGRNYKIFLAQLGDEMLGYVVLRCAVVRGIRTGLILDLLVRDHPQQMNVGASLMSRTEDFFRTREMFLAAGLMVPGAVEYRILLNAGYRCLPQALSPKQFRFAFFTKNASPESLQSLSIEDWFITFADNESH